MFASRGAYVGKPLQVPSVHARNIANQVLIIAVNYNVARLVQRPRVRAGGTEIFERLYFS